jgi:hypothetical protein
MPIYDLYNSRNNVNPIWKDYHYLKRAKYGDATTEPGFYSGSRLVGGKEGAWGSSDFLYTTLGENNHKYFKDVADYPAYEPPYSGDIHTGNSSPRHAQPVIPDFHFF